MISTDPVLLERSLTRASFWDFVQVFWDDVPGAATPVYSWHMEFLAQELQIVAERVFARQPRDYNLIVNISPGTSKSTLCSILFPCWVWTRMIKAKIIAASHTESLARDLATKSRAVLCSEHYRTVFPEVTLQEDREAKLDYANTRGGERCAFTVGGKSPMGRHGDIQIVDDPIDPKRAVSELELQEAEKFFTQVLPSRVTNKANSALILVMQRLHEADPTGVLLSKAKADGGAPVRHLCLPAELTEDIRPAELRPRYEAAGGLMDPARLPANVLREFQVTLGQYGYAGQFLQSPVPPGGGMFQISYFNQRCAAAPYKAKRVRYWDKAYCLAAGTLIETIRGSVPIEAIRAGDFVLTRKGYRRVEWSGLTKHAKVISVRFPNGAVLTGTPDHRVWTENRGWVRLDSLSCGDYNLYFTRGEESWHDGDRNGMPIRKSSNSTALTTDGVRENGTSRQCAGMQYGSATNASFCTARFGSFTTEKSPLRMSSITRMEIGTTTNFPIWSACRRESIAVCTTVSANITGRRKRESCVERTSKGYGNVLPIGRTTACTAESRFNHGILAKLPVTVRENVAIEHGASVPKSVAPFAESSTGLPEVSPFAVQKNVESSNAPPSALFVRRYFKKSQSISKDVPVAAQLHTDGKKHIPVYDLTVEGEHEFFANGVLVHNSTNETSCYTAGVLLAHAEDGGFFVEDCVHGQWNPAERDDIILATAYKDRQRYGPKYAPQIWIEQEPAAGIDSFRFLAKKLAGFPVFADKVGRNKEIRAQPWSSQCAARNVFIVESGWDINGWIDEHIHFPLGRLADRVDASGGAFTKLAGRTSSGKLTTYTFQGGKKKVIRILLVERAKLSEVVITEHTTLLINLNDPPVGVGVGVASSVTADPVAPPAPHGLSKLLAHLELDFADLQPSECQAHWDEPDERFGKKPEEIIFDRSRGKRLWTFLIRNRGADVFVLVDDGDRRALSLAYALCDVLNLPRGQTLCRYGDENWKAEPKEVAPNPHVFQMVKECRNLVVG